MTKRTLKGRHAGAAVIDLRAISEDPKFVAERVFEMLNGERVVFLQMDKVAPTRAMAIADEVGKQFHRHRRDRSAHFALIVSDDEAHYVAESSVNGYDQGSFLAGVEFPEEAHA